MIRLTREVRTVTVSCVVLVALASAVAAQGATVEAGRPAVVLDELGLWRVHHSLKPPLVQSAAGEMEPVLLPQAWLNQATQEPPTDWTKPDFDDSRWQYGPARVPCFTPYLSRLCLRKRFAVADPEKATGLKLTVSYHGGAVVCVNGQEVARGHMTAGPLAEPYPREAFVAEDGKLLLGGWRAQKGAEDKRRLALRTRMLADIEVPARLLRRGANVLAIEVIRAPYDAAVTDPEVTGLKPEAIQQQKTAVAMTWETCALVHVRLTAPASAGVVANVRRPEGLQLWNGDLMTPDFDVQLGNPSAPLRPVRIVGARNGWFSGKIIVGRSKPIRGLRVTPGDLRCGEATIPAAAIRVRYGIPWEGIPFAYEPTAEATSGQGPSYPSKVTSLSSLADAPLEEFPVRKEPERALSSMHPAPVPGAVVPIWLMAAVPRDVTAGEYAGRVTIAMEGEDAVEAPVVLSVAGWTLPDTQDYSTWVEMVQSPDTLAMEYGVPLCSEDHFALTARAFDLIAPSGSRVVYLPLIARTNYGNAESMVRWVPKADGGYDFDLSIMDRYLDTAEKHLGRPKLVVLNVWDIYMIKKERNRAGGSMKQEVIDARDAFRGKGPLVTRLDPVTGRTEDLHLPPHDDPSSEAVWSRLLGNVRERLAARGLDGQAMLGMGNDLLPTREEVEMLKRISGDMPWVCHSHVGHPKMYDVARVGYESRVQAFYPDYPRGDKSPSGGWRRPELVAEYERVQWFMSYPLAAWRHYAEFNIAGGQRGIGRLGADFWFAVKDKKGKRVGPVWQRFPESSWRNLDLYVAALAPGPDGPVTTTRFQVLREGVQECEARIFIERALADPERRRRLGDELTRRAETELNDRVRVLWLSTSTLQLNGTPRYYATYHDNRGRTLAGTVGHTWYAGSGWQGRSQRLFDLAAEVAKRLGRK